MKSCIFSGFEVMFTQRLILFFHKINVYVVQALHSLNRSGRGRISSLLKEAHKVNTFVGLTTKYVSRNEF